MFQSKGKFPEKKYLTPEELSIQDNLKYGKGVAFSPDMLTTGWSEGKKDYDNKVIEYDTRNAFEKSADDKRDNNYLSNMTNVIKPFLPSLIGGYMFNSPDDATNPVNLVEDMTQAGNNTAGNFSKIVTGGHKGNAPRKQLDAIITKRNDDVRSDAAADIGTQLIVGKVLQKAVPAISAFGKGVKKGYIRTRPAPYQPPTVDVPHTVVKPTGPGIVTPTTADKAKRSITEFFKPKVKRTRIINEVNLARFKEAAKGKNLHEMRAYAKNPIVKDRLHDAQMKSNPLKDYATINAYHSDIGVVGAYNKLSLTEKLDLAKTGEIGRNPRTNFEAATLGLLGNDTKSSFPLTYGNKKYLQKSLQREQAHTVNKTEKYRNSAEGRGALMDWKSTMPSYLKAAEPAIKKHEELIQASERPVPTLSALLPGKASVNKIFNKKGTANKEQFKSYINSPKNNIPNADIAILNSVIENNFANSKTVDLATINQEASKLVPKFNRREETEWRDYGVASIGHSDNIENKVISFSNEEQLGPGNASHYQTSPLAHTRYIIDKEGNFRILESQSDYYQGASPIAEEAEVNLIDAQNKLKEAKENGGFSQEALDVWQEEVYAAEKAIQQGTLKENIRGKIDMRLLFENMSLARDAGHTEIFYPKPSTVQKIQGYTPEHSKTYEYKHKSAELKKQRTANKTLYRTTRRELQRARYQRTIAKHKGESTVEIQENIDGLNDKMDEIASISEKLSADYMGAKTAQNAYLQDLVDKEAPALADKKAELAKLEGEYGEKSSEVIKLEREVYKHTRLSTKEQSDDELQLKEKLAILKNEQNTLGLPLTLLRSKINTLYDEALTKVERGLTQEKSNGLRDEHKTILRKYKNQKKDIKKFTGVEPLDEVDSKGNEWFRIIFPDGFMQKKAPFRAHKVGGILYKKI